MKETITVGNKVRLNSGGPLMTVKAVYEAAPHNTIVCSWICADGTPQEANFVPPCLQIIIDAIGKNDEAQKWKTQQAQDEMENEKFKRGFDRGAEKMKTMCVSKLKEAWVNTNGKYDVNKAVAVIESVEV